MRGPQFSTGHHLPSRSSEDLLVVTGRTPRRRRHRRRRRSTWRRQRETACATARPCRPSFQTAAMAPATTAAAGTPAAHPHGPSLQETETTSRALESRIPESIAPSLAHRAETESMARFPYPPATAAMTPTAISATAATASTPYAALGAALQPPTVSFRSGSIAPMAVATIVRSASTAVKIRRP
ncbi:uncharacterized protein [Setaria viridis]|uniref:uncharacterized protein isoform X2 n=1 Tax=Setaria viridis TaxID=4556 RepID=UPI001493987B|nr:ice-structuring glycoprotein-like isoform X5 [Setaria viridis]